MAMVDFSNAVLDVNREKPLNYQYLSTDEYNHYLMDANGNIINSNRSTQVLTNTPTTLSRLYTGSFTASGTEFYLGTYFTTGSAWKVSNVSFSSGDSYSFVIDIEVSGNT